MKLLQAEHGEAPAHYDVLEPGYMHSDLKGDGGYAAPLGEFALQRGTHDGGYAATLGEYALYNTGKVQGDDVAYSAPVMAYDSVSPAAAQQHYVNTPVAVRASAAAYTGFNGVLDGADESDDDLEV